MEKRTIYLQVERVGNDVKFTDSSRNEYSYEGTLSEKDNKEINYVIKSGRCVRFIVEGTDVKLGTAAIDKFNGSKSKPLDVAFLRRTTKTAEEKKLAPEQVTFLNFVHKEAVDLKPKMLFMSPLKWKYLVRSVVKGKNIMMTGAAGCGKTFAVQSLAKTFADRAFFFFNLGATQDPRSTLIGNTHFNKADGTYFAESEFIKAIQTPNAVILLDELSRAHPEAMNILMTVLDQGQRYLRLDEADGAPTVKVAEGVSFIATANIGAEYTATRVLDRALLDRFTIIEMDLLTVSDENSLLGMLYPQLEEKKINSIAEIACNTRNEMRSETPKVSTIISTRATVELASLLDDGFTLAESAEVAIYPFYDDAGGADSERTYITQLVQKYVEIEAVAERVVEQPQAQPVTDDIENKKPF